MSRKTKATIRFALISDVTMVFGTAFVWFFTEWSLGAVIMTACLSNYIGMCIGSYVNEKIKNHGRTLYIHTLKPEEFYSRYTK